MDFYLHIFSLDPRAWEIKLEQTSVFHMVFVVSLATFILAQHIAVLWCSWYSQNENQVGSTGQTLSLLHRAGLSPHKCLVKGPGSPGSPWQFCLSSLFYVACLLINLPWASTPCGYPLGSWDFPQYFTFPSLNLEVKHVCKYKAQHGHNFYSLWMIPSGRIGRHMCNKHTLIAVPWLSRLHSGKDLRWFWKEDVGKG